MIGLANNHSSDGSPGGRSHDPQNAKGGSPRGNRTSSPVLAGVKRPHSQPNHENQEAKRPRVEGNSNGSPRQVQHSPPNSSRPSPIPFRVQASPEIFRSAEMDQDASSNGQSSRASPGNAQSPRGGSPPRRVTSSTPKMMKRSGSNARLAQPKKPRLPISGALGKARMMQLV